MTQTEAISRFRHEPQFMAAETTERGKAEKSAMIDGLLRIIQIKGNARLAQLTKTGRELLG